MATGSEGVLYAIGGQGSLSQAYGIYKILWSPLTGGTVGWYLIQSTDYYTKIVVDSTDCVYATRYKGSLNKYSATGELLWTITESGVTCIGANGNLFAWATNYIKEYDLDGNLLNTWEYTCTGTPVDFYVNEDKEFFLITSSQLTRVNSNLSTLWTYAATIGDRCAAAIDKECNFYISITSGCGVRCINAIGEEIWNTGHLPESYNYYQSIWVDNIGAVYTVHYMQSYKVDYLHKIDAHTGEIIAKIPFDSSYTSERTGCADAYGNVYAWSGQRFHVWNTYIGTVNWIENEKTQEKFVVQELERGDGYMILLHDEEMMKT